VRKKRIKIYPQHGATYLYVGKENIGKKSTIIFELYSDKAIPSNTLQGSFAIHYSHWKELLEYLESENANED